MKVLITTDWYKPNINGVVTSVLNLADELTRMGHDVRILTLSRSTESYREDHVYYLRSFGFPIYPNVRGTIPYNPYYYEILDWDPDIVHSQCEFFTFGFAYRIARECGCPIVHTYHTMYEHYTQYLIRNKAIGSRIITPLIKLRLLNIDGIIAPTAKIKENLKNHLIVKNVKIIPTGIDLSKFHAKITPEERSELKAKYGIPEDHKILVNIGRMGQEKNIDELLRFFKKLKETIPAITFLLVGDGPYKKSLVQLTSSLGIDKDVIFTGAVSPDDVRRYYQLGDIFLSASTSETQGLTYVEALANGTCEVCKKDECLDGVLIHGLNGYIYDTEEEFIESTTRLLQDDPLRKQFSKDAELSSKKFSKEHFGREVLAFYESILKDFKPSGRVSVRRTAKRAINAGKKIYRLRSHDV